MLLPKLYLLLLAITMGKASGRKDLSEKDLELINRLEKSLLSSFGLDERPKVDKTKVTIPPYMFQLYKQKAKQDLEEREEVGEGNQKSKAASKYSTHNLANTVRSYTHSESFEDRIHPSNEMLLHFNVSNVPHKEILRGAELRITHLRHPSLPQWPSSAEGPAPGAKRRRWAKEELIYLHRIRVYDVLRLSKGFSDPVHRLLDTRVVDLRVNDTTTFDVSATLKRWLRKPHTNYGLFVEVFPLKRNFTLYKDPVHIRLRREPSQGPLSAQDWDQHQPLLVLHTDDQRIQSRKKRSAPITPFKRPLCSRYNLFVDFHAIDWNTWIVAPQGYDAFFCEGECPYPLAKHMNATNHAVIQNIIHSRYPNRVPSACCVPIKHSAISMLYLDKDRKVVLKTYQDMIVESCGCQ